MQDSDTGGKEQLRSEGAKVFAGDSVAGITCLRPQKVRAGVISHRKTKTREKMCNVELIEGRWGNQIFAK